MLQQQKFANLFVYVDGLFILFYLSSILGNLQQTFVCGTRAHSQCYSSDSHFHNNLTSYCEASLDISSPMNMQNNASHLLLASRLWKTEHNIFQITLSCGNTNPPVVAHQSICWVASQYVQRGQHWAEILKQLSESKTKVECRQTFNTSTVYHHTYSEQVTSIGDTQFFSAERQTDWHAHTWTLDRRKTICVLCSTPGTQVKIIMQLKSIAETSYS